jgi:hypothetical protein
LVRDRSEVYLNGEEKLNNMNINKEFKKIREPRNKKLRSRKINRMTSRKNKDKMMKMNKIRKMSWREKC